MNHWRGVCWSAVKKIGGRHDETGTAVCHLVQCGVGLGEVERCLCRLWPYAEDKRYPMKSELNDYMDSREEEKQ